MTRTNSYSRLKRLELLAAQLKQEGFCTIRDLAEAHQVSDRTIARDLQLMRDEQGLPIETDRGRGGGIRIARNWGVGRLSLSYAEAVDLLISIAVAEQMQSPLFLGNLASIRRQLIASFSSDRRERVERLKSRILIGYTASATVQNTMGAADLRAIQPLHQGFLDQTAIRIRYKAESGKTTAREIEAHYLVLNYPVWYVLAFDKLRAACRVFRCDRILAANATETPFDIQPLTAFEPPEGGYYALK
ncbi:helix-turn-helix transcriptional regulator [Maricaulis sp.]|uniref:helix-turn-helix transcriptional regulator n=1 Tax=Maricaulis sp. TaxID=1486257 RepID=UPI003A92FC7A